jgi:hypothetical protein
VGGLEGGIANGVGDAPGDRRLRRTESPVEVVLRKFGGALTCLGQVDVLRPPEYVALRDDFLVARTELDLVTGF